MLRTIACQGSTTHGSLRSSHEFTIAETPSLCPCSTPISMRCLRPPLIQVSTLNHAPPRITLSCPRFVEQINNRPLGESWGNAAVLMFSLMLQTHDTDRKDCTVQHAQNRPVCNIEHFQVVSSLAKTALHTPFIQECSSVKRLQSLISNKYRPSSFLIHLLTGVNASLGVIVMKMMIL